MAKKRKGHAPSPRQAPRPTGPGNTQRVFYLALGAILLIGAAALAYAWRRGAEDAAPVLIERDAPVGGTLGYVQGSPDAAVEIIEFADFECPGCAQFTAITEPAMRARLIETGKARFRFLDLQVNESHRNSPLASVAAACANDQGKFWEMHDLLFAGQEEWSSYATANPKPVFQRYAREVGVDARTWERCFDERRHFERIAAHSQEARRVGMRFTPSFVIGRRLLSGGQFYDAIEAAVDSAIAESKPATKRDSTKPDPPSRDSTQRDPATRDSTKRGRPARR